MKGYLFRTLVVVAVITMLLASSSFALARTSPGTSHTKIRHASTHHSHKTRSKSSHHAQSHDKSHAHKTKSTRSHS